jgi:signal transduction histidine kinase
MHRSSIKSRLFVLVTVFGIAVALLNLAFLWGLTKWVEDFIFDSLIREEFSRLEALQGFGPPKEAGESGTFRAHFRVDDFPAEWQPWLAVLPDGIHELESDISLLAMIQSGRDGQRRYLVVQTDELEYIESNLSTVVLFAILVILLTLAGAVIVSLYLVRRIIGPLNQFTQEISELEVSGSLEPIAGNYGDDEIGTLAGAFDHLQERLKAYIRRERRFTADISHELRTPLAVSGNALELLAERPLSDEDARVIDRLHRSIHRMRALVETFIALARQENASPEASSSVTLDSLVDGSLEFHKYAYPQTTPVVDRAYERDLELEGSPMLLSILFRNLIINAILYSPDQTCRITGAPGRVWITNAISESPGASDGVGIGLSIAERVSDALAVKLSTHQVHGRFEAVVEW